jgi:hypothetical protein
MKRDSEHGPFTSSVSEHRINLEFTKASIHHHLYVVYNNYKTLLNQNDLAVNI